MVNFDRASAKAVAVVVADEAFVVVFAAVPGGREGTDHREMGDADTSDRVEQSDLGEQAAADVVAAAVAGVAEQYEDEHAEPLHLEEMELNGICDRKMDFWKNGR